MNKDKQLDKQLAIKVEFEWNHQHFSCILFVNMHRYDFSWSNSSESFTELKTIYELLIELNTSCDDIEGFAQEFKIEYLQNIYAVLFFKYFRRIYPNLRLLEVAVAKSEVINERDIISNGLDEYKTLQLQDDLSIFSQVIVVANNIELLNKICLQYEVLQYVPQLPKLSPISGICECLSDGVEYQLHAKEQIYVADEPSGRNYLKVKLQINSNNVVLFITDEIIYHFTRIIFGEDVDFSMNLFFSKAVLDVLIFKSNVFIMDKVTLIDFYYTSLGGGEYIQIDFSSFSNKLNGLIFLEYKSFIKCRDIMAPYFINPETKKCIDGGYNLEFPVQLFENTMSMSEINNLQVGDVVILDDNLHRTSDDSLQNVVIKLGDSCIKCELINENQIKIV